MYKVSGFFGFKVYPVNPKILSILIQTIIYSRIQKLFIVPTTLGKQ